MELACVTGMHRSGTSMIARAIATLGADLGEDEALLPAGDDNQAGYWEPAAVKRCNDAVLARMGGTWSVPPVLPLGWERDAALDDLRTEAAEALAASFPDGRPISCRVVKDPRLSLTLPFWRTVADVPATVSVLRSPRSVMASLAERNGMAAEPAALLWLRYVLAAHLGDPAQLLVVAEAHRADPEPSLRGLAAHLGLPAPTGTLTDAAVAEIRPDLWHHRNDEPLTDDLGPIGELVDRCWNGGMPDPSRVLDDPALQAVATGRLVGSEQVAELAHASAAVADLTERLRRRSENLHAMRERRDHYQQRAAMFRSQLVEARETIASLSRSSDDGPSGGVA